MKCSLEGGLQPFCRLSGSSLHLHAKSRHKSLAWAGSQKYVCPHNPVYPAGLFHEPFLHKEYRPPFQAGQPDYPKSLISVIKALMDCSQDINHANPFFKLVECAGLVHARGLPVEVLRAQLSRKAPDTTAPNTQAISDNQGASPSGSHMQTKLPPTVSTEAMGIFVKETPLNLLVDTSLSGILLLSLCPGKQSHCPN